MGINEQNTFFDESDKNISNVKKYQELNLSIIKSEFGETTNEDSKDPCESKKENCFENELF